MSFNGKLRRFRHLSGEQKSVCLKAPLLIPFVRLQLKLRGIKSTASFWQLNQIIETSTAMSADAKRQAHSIAHALALAAPHIPGGNHCLTRSVVLISMLNRRGIQGLLRIGVTSPASFQAHAWVELTDGVLLNERPADLQRYQQLQENRRLSNR